MTTFLLYAWHNPLYVFARMSLGALLWGAYCALGMCDDEERVS